MAKKKPKVSYSPLGKHIPRTPSQAESFATAKLMWRTSDADMGGPFGWHEICRIELLKEVIDKLHDLGTQTFAECIAPGKNNHSIPVEQIVKEAQERLVEIKCDEYDELVSLRLTGKKRVWAIRDGAILRILWWDPEHKVCPSYKKNT